MGRQDGLDYLVEAARVIICEWRRYDIQFVLVGAGPEFPRLRERVQSLGIAEHVVFTGRLSDEELGAVLATADVCVNPDEANRMNDISTMNKVLEYMALGKPMVQFDLHEGRVSAGDSSLYATRNDATALAACIARLVDDPQARARMGQCGLQRLRTTLSWDLQVPQLLAAYDRAIGKQGRATADTPRREPRAPRPASLVRVPAPALEPVAAPPPGRVAAHDAFDTAEVSEQAGYVLDRRGENVETM
jgi:glycosyltransferase involved in cell wall biosynthesis